MANLFLHSAAYKPRIPYARNFIAAAGLTDATQQQACYQLEADLLATKLLHAYDHALSRLSVWYPAVGGTSRAHALNFVNPSAYALTFFGSPVHDSTGIRWNGVNQYADTGFTASSFSTQQNAGLHYYTSDNLSQNDVYELGSYAAGSSAFHLSANNGAVGGRQFGRAFRADYNLVAPTAPAPGLVSITRDGSNDVNSTARLLRNGIEVASAPDAEFAPAPSIWLGALHVLDRDEQSMAYGHTSNRCTGAGISVGLTPPETLALYQAVHRFNTTLNRAA